MVIIELLKTILFGIVEGITEWLPISSTGHMILLNQLISLNVSQEFYSMFEVVIQFGAILAVIILFWKKIWPFGKKNNPKPMANSGVGAWVNRDIFSLWLHIIVSCLPVVIIGLPFDDLFEKYFYNYVTVAITLIVFGIAFLIIERLHRGKEAKITSIRGINYRIALLIGAFQLLAAIFPGTSRSGAIIIGALLLGISRAVAAEYAFYLAIPVMFGASLLKIVKFGFHFSLLEAVILLLGMAVAFVVSWFVIRFFMNYIRKHDFKVFGWYRIALGAIVLLCGILGFLG